MAINVADQSPLAPHTTSRNARLVVPCNRRIVSASTHAHFCAASTASVSAPMVWEPRPQIPAWELHPKTTNQRTNQRTNCLINESNLP